MFNVEQFYNTLLAAAAFGFALGQIACVLRGIKKERKGGDRK